VRRVEARQCRSRRLPGRLSSLIATRADIVRHLPTFRPSSSKCFSFRSHSVFSSSLIVISSRVDVVVVTDQCLPADLALQVVQVVVLIIVEEEAQQLSNSSALVVIDVEPEVEDLEPGRLLHRTQNVMDT
jgi:hypothetical protein